MLEIFGYLAAIMVGLSMGLVGGGGSILIIPILVYLLQIEPLAATTYSFFVVGIISLVGAVMKIQGKQVNLKMALLFGIPDIIGVITMRTFIFPPIPGNLFMLSNHMVTKSELVMVIFSIIMIISSISMVRKKDNENEDVTGVLNKPIWFFFILGTLTGWLTGMVGVGGGFLIIPVLVLYAGLPMKQAVGTSLVIIATKSLFGFLSGHAHYQVEYKMAIILSALALIGLFIGNILSRKISSKLIQTGFGWSVLVLGIYMLIKETIY